MNPWEILGVIVLGGIGTFLIRYSFIYLGEKLPMPGWFRRGLRFVPVAVLSAIIVPELATLNGAINLSPANPQLLAGALAIVVAWRTKNMILTIVVGMVALVVLQAAGLGG